MSSSTVGTRSPGLRALRRALGLLILGTLLGPAPREVRAQASPGTDIWALPLAGSPPAVDPASALRITHRAGYDNQPHFAPGDRLILYTAIDSAGQADIWRFDLDSGERVNVTGTAPESEYSATVTPDLTRFSVIRVEADSAQRLWTFESGGTDPQVILPAIRPVGYHAWIDGDRLALFVLGDPATLQVASVSSGSAQVVARDIGRSLHRIPGGTQVSFVQWDPDGTGRIQSYDPDTEMVEPLAPLPGDNEFHAWTPDGLLVTGQGSRLFWWRPGESEAWQEFADLGGAGIRSISRVAVAESGKWMAVVAQDGPGEGRSSLTILNHSK